MKGTVYSIPTALVTLALYTGHAIESSHKQHFIMFLLLLVHVYMTEKKLKRKVILGALTITSLPAKIKVGLLWQCHIGRSPGSGTLGLAVQCLAAVPLSHWCFH